MKKIYLALFIFAVSVALFACKDDNDVETVTLTVWASELDQSITQTLINGFIEEYETDEVKFNIQLGALSEAQAKDQVLADIEGAADVFTFADDQFDDLFRAGVFQEVVENTQDVINRNASASIKAATNNGKLYAYPMTADNGYFLFYDKSVYTEDDIKTLDGILAAAQADGSKFTFDLKSGWYTFSFFRGAGLTIGYDGTRNNANWNKSPEGVQVVQAMTAMANHAGYVYANDAEFQAGMKNGTITAGVNGVWNASVAEEAWGENYAAAKLPTYTLAGTQKQMYSFAGFKLVGVNQTTEFPGWAMKLADWLTNEAAQIARFEARGLGPSNTNAASSDEVLANPAIAALAQQAAFSEIQRVEGSYWAPTEALGVQIVEKTIPTDVNLIQQVLDQMVQGMNTPAA